MSDDGSGVSPHFFQHPIKNHLSMSTHKQTQFIQTAKLSSAKELSLLLVLLIPKGCGIRI